LAEELLINPNTVARAYRELEVASIVFKRGTADTFVSNGPSPLARRERLRILRERVDALLAEASSMGIGIDELRALIDQRDGEDPMHDDSPVIEEPVVEIARLSRRFGSTIALNEGDE
jgi:DNA-binding transcriptional regulator YhcF (GntR family)